MSGNANTWWNHNDSYERGQIAQLGAIACWENNNTYDNAPGHVAIVEEIYPDGSYLTSNSNWGNNHDGEYFIMYHIPSNNYLASFLTFQGFIYNPEITPVGDKINLILLNGLKRRRNNVEGKTIFGSTKNIRTRK